MIPKKKFTELDLVNKQKSALAILKQRSQQELETLRKFKAESSIRLPSIDPFFSTTKTVADKPKSRYKHGRTKFNNGHRFQEVKCIDPS